MIEAVDHNKIDEELFYKRIKGNYMLIYPRSRMADPRLWNVNNFWNRSRIINWRTGRILSQGFKKFFNYGERELIDSRLREWIKEGKPIYHSEKIDGSLAIRSVIDRKVNLRARNTFDLENMPEIAETAKLTPSLLDPSIGEGLSILLEHVTPKYKIILEYPQPEFYLLAIIHNDSLQMLSLEELKTYAEIFQLETPPVHKIPSDNIGAIETYLRQREEMNLPLIEGFVIQFDQDLVKIKTEKYCELHSMKFSLTYAKIVDFCREHNIRNYNDFEVHWVSYFDYETLEFTKDYATTYFERLKELEKALKVARETCEFILSEIGCYSTLTNEYRKEFADLAKQVEDKRLVPMLFAFLDNHSIDKIEEKALKSFIFIKDSP